MSGIDFDRLLQPTTAEEPAGTDVEYDPAYQEMRRAAAGEPERRMGNSVIHAIEPNWARVASLAGDLLSRSKDLRVAILLSKALLQTHGFPGLNQGLTLTLGLLTKFWDGLYPRLEAEDDNDPTTRVNALLELCDREAFLNPVRATPLIVSRAFGAITLRDLEIAEGRTPAPARSDKPPIDLTTANAAFRDCAVEDLQRTASAVSSALEKLRRIEILVTEKIGASNSPDLAPLADLLTEANALLGKLLDDRSQVAEPESGGPREESDETSPAPGSVRRATSAQAGGAINSREDVIGMLDRLCEYYAHNEPSSPVPLLLHRARRLVPKDFMDIVRDIAPGALPQVEAIRGTEDDS